MKGVLAFFVALLPLLLACCGGGTADAEQTMDFSGQVAIGGGRSLYLSCKGSGSPVVVLESGIHDSSDPWSLTETEPPEPSGSSVFDGVARFTRVCKYDRPGTIRYTDPIALTTRSSPVYGPRTLAGMVRDLRALLLSAGVPGPYVLVAHSYGGLILRLFAQQYPAEAAGLVLVDAFGTDIKPLFGELWPAYEGILNQPGTPLDAMPGFETVDADEAIAAVNQAPPLPAIPLAVISKTEPFATAPTVPEAIRKRLEQVWPEVQDRLVGLEPQTPHILATGSDHYVQLRDPDLVVGVIRLIFERAREGDRR